MKDFEFKKQILRESDTSYLNRLLKHDRLDQETRSYVISIIQDRLKITFFDFTKHTLVSYIPDNLWSYQF